jgi:hypothetical protein
VVTSDNVSEMIQWLSLLCPSPRASRHESKTWRYHTICSSNARPSLNPGNSLQAGNSSRILSTKVSPLPIPIRLFEAFFGHIKESFWVAEVEPDLSQIEEAPGRVERRLLL